MGNGDINMKKTIKLTVFLRHPPEPNAVRVYLMGGFPERTL